MDGAVGFGVVSWREVVFVLGDEVEVRVDGGFGKAGGAAGGEAGGGGGFVDGRGGGWEADPGAGAVGEEIAPGGEA